MQRFCLFLLERAAVGETSLKPKLPLFQAMTDRKPSDDIAKCGDRICTQKGPLTIYCKHSTLISLIADQELKLLPHFSTESVTVESKGRLKLDPLTSIF